MSDAMAETVRSKIFEKLNQDDDRALLVLRSLGIDYDDLVQKIILLMTNQGDVGQSIKKTISDKLSISNPRAERIFSEETQDFLFQAISALNAIKTFNLAQILVRNPADRKSIPIWLEEKFVEFINEATVKGFLPQEIFSARILRESGATLQNLVDNLSRHVAKLCDVNIGVLNLHSVGPVFDQRREYYSLQGMIDAGEDRHTIIDNINEYVQFYRQSDDPRELEGRKDKVNIDGILFHPNQGEIIDAINSQPKLEMQNPYMAALKSGDIRFLLGENEEEAVQKSRELLDFLSHNFNNVGIGHRHFFGIIHDMISASNFSNQFSPVLEWIEMHMVKIIFEDFRATAVGSDIEGVHAVFDEAFPWLRDAEGRGNPNAQMLLGYYYEKIGAGLHDEDAKMHYRNFCYNLRNKEDLSFYENFISHFALALHSLNVDFSQNWFAEFLQGNDENICAWFLHQASFGLTQVGSENLRARDELLSRVDESRMPQASAIFKNAIAKHYLVGADYPQAINWFLRALENDPCRETIIDVLDYYLGSQAANIYPQNISLLSNEQKHSFFTGTIDYLLTHDEYVLSTSFIEAAARCFNAIRDDEELMDKINEIVDDLAARLSSHGLQHMARKQINLAIANYLSARGYADDQNSLFARYVDIVNQANVEAPPTYHIEEGKQIEIAAAVKISQAFCDLGLWNAMEASHKDPNFIRKNFKVYAYFVDYEAERLTDGQKELQQQAMSVYTKMLFCEHLDLDDVLIMVLGNKTMAAKVIEQLYKDKNHEALNRLGNMYYYGQDVGQDYTKALRCYKFAALQGNAEAKYNLGYCYLNKIGTPTSLSDGHLQELGKSWLEQAITDNAPSSTKARALLTMMNPVTNFAASTVVTAAENLRDKVRGVGGTNSGRIH